ncbi:ComF family protein [Enteractinococcus fodinae]|nr:hypothetical protein [Enteractinococcus fodinae]
MRLLHRLDSFMTSPVAQHVGRAWGGMMNLLVPNPCALCVWSDAEKYHLCRVCTALLRDQTRQVIQAQDFADALPLDIVTGQPLPVFAASLYTPEMARLVLNFKDHQRIKLAQVFRPIMYRTLQYATQDCGSPSYRVVPIPTSGAGMRKRGYNPVTMMLPSPLPDRLHCDPGLLKTRWNFFSRTAHHGSGVQARRESARRKFRLARRHQEPAEPIILVDDVLTTGATLAGAARTLQAAGFDIAAAVVLSTVIPRS